MVAIDNGARRNTRMKAEGNESRDPQTTRIHQVKRIRDGRWPKGTARETEHSVKEGRVCLRQYLLTVAWRAVSHKSGTGKPGPVSESSSYNRQGCGKEATGTGETCTDPKATEDRRIRKRHGQQTGAISTTELSIREGRAHPGQHPPPSALESNREQQQFI
jgi:hypothetical protein